ncbi:hypothetical protein GCM10010174_08660 [Kutzneria viridogrisea]|uniref:Uncharacterized protein n=1 Tax=Kutzneria viridogrisea TaxID=47990 RepID=A0ABR6BX75_9PSEU|nr:hypothetical protein [Kutzneria viridogrisea]
MTVDEATAAADEAIEKMAKLRSTVQQQRAESDRKLAEAKEQNQQVVDKAIAEAKAKREGKRTAVPARDPRPEAGFTFFDTEDEYQAPQRPAAPVAPEFTPPPKPTPRRHARPVAEDEDEDYSNQTWMQ